VITIFAVDWNLGFAIPMAIGTLGGLVSFILALLLSPETKGTELVPDLLIA
jgi:SHS family lactate transporter-like MFS transporter